MYCCTRIRSFQYSVYPADWKPDTTYRPAAKAAKEYPFTLDPFQKQAIQYIERNESVLVSAHTSAGKVCVLFCALVLKPGMLLRTWRALADTCWSHNTGVHPVVLFHVLRSMLVEQRGELLGGRYAYLEQYCCTLRIGDPVFHAEHFVGFSVSRRVAVDERLPGSKYESTTPFETQERTYSGVSCNMHSRSLVGTPDLPTILSHFLSFQTVNAEYAIAKCLRDKQRVIYTSPIKALSNQKFRDLQVRYEGKSLAAPPE